MKNFDDFLSTLDGESLDAYVEKGLNGYGADAGAAVAISQQIATALLREYHLWLHKDKD